MTLGLSHHISHQTEGPDLRLEFLVACDEGTIDLFNPASVLADICDIWFQNHHAPARGTVIGPRGRFFKESEMAALYCSPPLYFHQALSTFPGFPEPFVPIWLIPITPDEAQFIREHGWPAFEHRLAEAETDLLNLCRPSLAPGEA
jgi:hypothetical protein